jgi:hypothetical protein
MVLVLICGKLQIVITKYFCPVWKPIYSALALGRVRNLTRMYQRYKSTKTNTLGVLTGVYIAATARDIVSISTHI